MPRERETGKREKRVTEREREVKKAWCERQREDEGLDREQEKEREREWGGHMRDNEREAVKM